jgi:serine/threonine protein kinase
MVGKIALGKYRLLRSLGAGSNAEVFLAEVVRAPKEWVVVKRIHDHVVKHAKFQTLFEAETRSMANFNHPYAVKLIEASLTDPIGPCLVMEYVPGLTLEEVLRKHRSLPPGRVALLLGYLCHALQAAHNAGIIHRDLKPSNLMVMNAGQETETIKVMDFGFAGFAAKPHIQLAELTGCGPIYAMGTPGYVSPEMIRGDPVDARSDLYSVGVILFEMLTGRLPFNYQTQEKLLAAHVKESPPKFHKIGCGHIPPAVDAVVQLALAKYPNERPQSAHVLADMFGQAFGEPLWEATAPPGWEDADLPMAEEVEEAPPVPKPRPRSGNPFEIAHEFEALMPERMAAAKLRGVIEDVNGVVLASEPGVIRMRVGLPPGYKDPAPGGSAVVGWLSGVRKPAVSRGQEPIELELQLEKRDPSQARLSVVVAFRPLKDYQPRDSVTWETRCDKLHAMLRAYLGT